MLLSPRPDPLLEALVPLGSTAVVLLGALEPARQQTIGLDRLMAEAGLPQARRQDSLQVLHLLTRHTWLIEREAGWQRTEGFDPTLRWRLTGALQALAFRAGQQAEIVLTQGAHAQALREAITACVPCSPILRTDELFREMVATTPAGAPVYFVMPFFDEAGLRFLAELTQHLPKNAQIRLITRVPQAETAAKLLDLQAKTRPHLSIRIYQRVAEQGYETFHAKLVAHGAAAYVGSANLTQASLGVSAELGVYIKDRSAEAVFQLAEVVWSISKAVH